MIILVDTSLVYDWLFDADGAGAVKASLTVKNPSHTRITREAFEIDRRVYSFNQHDDNHMITTPTIPIIETNCAP